LRGVCFIIRDAKGSVLPTQILISVFILSIGEQRERVYNEDKGNNDFFINENAFLFWAGGMMKWKQKVSSWPQENHPG